MCIQDENEFRTIQKKYCRTTVNPLKTLLIERACMIQKLIFDALQLNCQNSLHCKYFIGISHILSIFNTQHLSNLC